MKVYVILESYTDCDGGNATSFGVYKTMESAIEHLPQAVLERHACESIKDWEDDYGLCFDDYMSLDRRSWSWDRDDNLIEYYIQEDELED